MGKAKMAGSAFPKVTAPPAYVIPGPLHKALKTVRKALAEAELSVAGEFDLNEIFNGRRRGPAVARSRILLVDSPLLTFQAIALNRAAAAFLPLHVLASEDGGRTLVSVDSPTALFDLRFPVGAVSPLDLLYAQIVRVLERVSQRLEVKPV